MASRAALGELRKVEMRRLKELLGVDFKFTPGGPEMQHVMDLRACADAAARKLGVTETPAPVSTEGQPAGAEAATDSAQEPPPQPPQPQQRKGASHGREAIANAVRGVGSQR